MGAWGTDPCTVKNLHYNFSRPSISMVLHSQIQPTEDHIVLQYVFTENYLCISGPVQFKPVLFKDQLYCDFILLKG